MGLIPFTVNDRLRLNTAFGTFSFVTDIVTNRVKQIAILPQDELVFELPNPESKRN